MWKSIVAGWVSLKKGMALWMITWVVSLLFWQINQHFLLPEFRQLLPTLPSFNMGGVPLEGYLLLFVEGSYAITHSPLFQKTMLMFGLVLLARLLLQPLLHLFIFSHAMQSEEGSSLKYLWGFGRPQLRSFYLSYALQLFLGALLGWGCLTLVKRIGMSAFLQGSLFHVFWLMAVLFISICFGLLFYSFITYWRTAIAAGEQMSHAVKKGLNLTLRHKPFASLILPFLYLILLQPIIAGLQLMASYLWPAVLVTVLLLALQAFLMLWLTFSLASHYPHHKWEG